MDLALFVLGLLIGCLTRGKLLIFSEPPLIAHRTVLGACSKLLNKDGATLAKREAGWMLVAMLC